MHGARGGHNPVWPPLPSVSVVESPIVLSDEGDEDEDDTARLSELIALAEAGL